ncbi:hypothetical protein C2142_29055 [Streptomyces sp. CB01881]|nr:hypothetical protein C2142_29055 [Streptomyces sp. CB01881]
MVEFSDLRHAPVSGIDRMAGAFESLVRGWELSSELTGDVITPLQGSGWRGPAAEQAAGAIAKVRTEIDAAFEEASGLAKALRDAHTELAGAQADLKAAVQSATDHGMTVDDSGSVHWPPATSTADKNDPDYANTYRQKASGVADAIAKALARAAAADSAAAVALAADTGINRASFRGAPGTRLPEEAAREAAGILQLAGNASDAQLAHLNQLLKDHAGDPAFATAFYGSLGPDGFLASYGKLAAASAKQGGGRPQVIADLQARLGTALATATNSRNEPHLSDEWEAGLRKAGSTRVAIWPDGQPGGSAQPFGYQILTNILRTGTYDPHFLNPIAEHVTQLSERQGFWTSDQWNAAEFSQYRFLGTQQGGFNPMVGVLEALGHNPDAATSYFHDPATLYNLDGTVAAVGQANKYLDALTTAGWNSPLQDVWPGHSAPMGHAEPLEAAALGHALEAATTGRAHDSADAPLPPHTPEMAAVMKSVVDRFGSGDGPGLLAKGGLFAGLNGGLGHMTAAYMGDVQASLSPHDTTLTTYGTKADLDRANTEKLLEALGHHPDAYGAIAQAQQAYSTAHIQDIMQHREQYKDLFGAAVQNAARPGGVVAGILTAGMTDEVYVQKQAEATAYNDAIDHNAIWAKTIWAVTGGAVLGAIPVVGGGMSYPVNGLIDSVAAGYQVTPQASDDATKAHDAGQSAAAAAAAAAVKKAGQGAGLEQPYLDTLATSAANSVLTGHTSGENVSKEAIHG